MLLPVAIVEDLTTPADIILRPAFDTVWQSAGYRRSMNYNEQGRWV